MVNDFATQQDMQNAYMSAAQSGQQSDPNSLYADYMREEKVKNVIQQLNPDNLVEDIEHRIRGEKKDRFSGEWVLIDKNSRISELLIGRYISYLSSTLNQNTSLSNYSSGEINNLMEMVVDHLKYDLSDNAEAYGFVVVNEIEIDAIVKILVRKQVGDKIITTYITKPIKQKKVIEEVVDYNEMNRIAMIICGTTFSVLKRAMNGMEARRVFGALHVNESLNEQGGKKSFMDNFKFWK
jgi:hypothetical protein